MENLTGKTAFITGGASGLGLGIAKACAKAGMNIVIADFRQQAIDEALPAFKENGWPAHGIQLDVTDRAAYVKAADEAEAVFGKLHVLVNNAGIGIPEGKVWEDDFKDVDLAIDVNYRGVLNGIMTIVPRILKHGEGGHVVSTASKAGLVPVPGFTLYNSLKMAVVTVMETLACDLQGTGVGASVFCPGPFQTNLGLSSGEVRAKHLGVELPPFAPPPPKDGEAPPPQADFTKIIRYPEEAGERVVRGIRRGDLYIITHADFKKGWDARAAAVSRAFPDEPLSDDFQKVFSILTYNPVFEKQTQVPAFEK
ncbi:NADP-dependent 3-hydroxy acid dehydrogenase YdfG [Sporobacter termitidis DSM 10068]|uniref:NADP-dependent 3-hydroxy acid dehydrogenase YdfG n=1 Tax=Sporobacter termitidis DSM 10068 TaxID=1123282 RepID=A0A1M5Y7H8_9FIRM|nr:SDR family NAD(P)-dependent oxidoreductase [Sporobacter termitidis]SHI07932.1 NADP-dependent 3-hydroxy acid dehydrogenase YdfG [Sporobacter termitidis DSM 10068]